MLITLSVIQGLNQQEFDLFGYHVKFYFFGDRIWCELNDDETNETLFEGQITNSNELKNLCEEVEDITNINSMTFMGLIITRLMDIENKLK